MVPTYTYDDETLIISYNGNVVMEINNLPQSRKIHSLNNFIIGPYDDKSFKYDNGLDAFVEIEQ